jgi:glyoxylase-like metal-dependent hydrolase (beta-lactamase superfamily II)
MEVSPSVRAVQVPDDNPMHPQMTTMYIVGKDQVLTIDSGEDMDRYRWMLRGYLAATERAEIALAGITHHHFDHSANLKWIREIYGADILVHEDGKAILEDRLPDSGVDIMREGHVIDLGGGVRVRVLHTPGHSVDSVCYYLEEEGVLFSGDTTRRRHCHDA